VKITLIWDEAKREANLAKHGLDFADAAWVLESDYRMDAITVRKGEQRVESMAYVFDRLRVLMVVHVPRKTYHEWLAQEPDDS
jgi:uncharacterized DUF497 family protein